MKRNAVLGFAFFNVVFVLLNECASSTWVSPVLANSTERRQFPRDNSVNTHNKENQDALHNKAQDTPNRNGGRRRLGEMWVNVGNSTFNNTKTTQCEGCLECATYKECLGCGDSFEFTTTESTVTTRRTDANAGWAQDLEIVCIISVGAGWYIYHVIPQSGIILSLSP